MDTLKYKTKEKMWMVTRLMTVAVYDLLYDDPHKALQQVRQALDHTRKIVEWIEKIIADSE